MNNVLIVLAQSLEQPRIVKRINQKAKEYEKVHVYGFTRNVHAVQNHKVLEENDNVTINVVGQLKNNQYFRRAFVFLKLLSLIYAKYGLRKKSIYVFGLDLRALSFFIMNANVDYEISDIVWLYSGKTKRKLMSFLDKFLAGKSRKVVFTTKSFYDGYYKDKVSESQVIVKENKLETYNRVGSVEQIQTDKLRISYIGAFRYAEIIKNLTDVVVGNEDIILNFYGATHGGKIIEDIEKAVNENSNIHYHGPFKNPDDLEKIYEANNLNFVVYDNTLENEKVAMPNKYYESGFFNIPIVCAKGTYVGERVLENKMGWTIDTDKNSISDFLNTITISELMDCHENIKTLDKQYFVA
ncbi:hypothetical protein [Flagellimonas sp.]|uniref:hypothetical protein n=1 Tax=Flagellimonas sp. TaxID=2058762 RepID=UPI003BA9C3FC|tara:strand:- start:63 stop:1124 length:1062 start_codon:yes stop_codon:yes gene_type:complete